MYEISKELPFAEFYVKGTLSLPVKAESLIIFTHFKDSYIQMPNPQKLAFKLREKGFGTLVFNLRGQYKILSETSEKSLNIFSDGLCTSTKKLHNHSEYRSLDFAFMGAGLGAAIAFKSAVKLNSNIIKSMALFSGDFNFDQEDLAEISCPTLLAVGEYDLPNIEINKNVKDYLKKSAHLSVVKDAHDLSKEPCPTDKIINTANSWFKEHLALDLEPALI